jgi:predicted GIY-YIG superfamily endonuclease
VHPRFAEIVAQLEPSLQSLLAAARYKPLSVPKAVAPAGIYLLSEGNQYLYVGRSNRISKRLGNHCRIGATYKMAAFAFRLARETTGMLQATYTKEGSRRALMQEPTFVRAFDAAKARIRDMDVRVVREPDPVRQTILEVYVAVALQTPYNDFDTH